MVVFYIAMAIGLILLFGCMGYYLYHVFQRLLSMHHHFNKKNDKKKKMICMILTLVYLILSVNIFSMLGIILIHFFFAMIIIDIFNLFFQRFHHRIWDFLYRSEILALCITLIYIGYGYINIHHVKDTNYHIETVKNIDKIKICFISDLHMATTMNAKDLRRYCQDITSQNIDLFILGGDIVDEKTTHQQLQDMAKILGRVKTKYGIYYVYGNHDSFDNQSMNPILKQSDLKKAFKDNHINILNDNVTLIHNQFYLVGRYDAAFSKSGGRQSLKELSQNIDFKKYTLLLDHQPIDLKEASQLGYDLQLSGHTHGGQIWPLGQMNELLKTNELEYGLKKIGKFNAIVSSGIGGWGYPIRTFSSCEIVYITIHTK